MSKPLRSCPYCKKGDFLKIINKPSHRQVNCEYCGGRGPTQGVKDRMTAEEMWNSRDDAAKVLDMIWHQYFFHTYAPPIVKEEVKRILNDEQKV